MSWTVNPTAPRLGRYRCDQCAIGYPKPTWHLCRGRRRVAPWVTEAVAKRTAVTKEES